MASYARLIDEIAVKACRVESGTVCGRLRPLSCRPQTDAKLDAATPRCCKSRGTSAEEFCSCSGSRVTSSQTSALGQLCCRPALSGAAFRIIPRIILILCVLFHVFKKKKKNLTIRSGLGRVLQKLGDVTLVVKLSFKKMKCSHTHTQLFVSIHLSLPVCLYISLPLFACLSSCLPMSVCLSSCMSAYLWLGTVCLSELYHFGFCLLISVLMRSQL